LHLSVLLIEGIAKLKNERTKKRKDEIQSRLLNNDVLYKSATPMKFNSNTEAGLKKYNTTKIFYVNLQAVV